MSFPLAVGLDLVVVLAILGIGYASSAAYRRFEESDIVETGVRKSRPLALAVGIASPIVVSRRLEPGAIVASRIGDGTAADVVLALGNATLAVTTMAVGVATLVWSQRSLPDSFWLRDEPVFEGYERRGLVAILLPAVGTALWIELLGTGVVTLGWIWLVPALILGFVVWQALVRPMGPFSEGVESTRAPRTEERSRIRDAFGRFEREPDWIVVFEGSDRGSLVGGASNLGRRATWIAESALKSWDDEELAVALAQADERANRHFQELQYASLGSWWLAAWFLGYAIVTLDLYPIALPGAAVSIVAAQLFRWTARRAVYESDEFAAEHLGPATVHRTYERLRDDVDYVPEGRREGSTPPLAFLFTTAIPFADRLERLGDGSGVAE